MSDENYAKYLERARQYAAAQRLKEDVQHLKARWLRYNFPVQELLRLLLTKHGLEVATLATDALDRQYSRTTIAVTTTSQPSVVASAHGASSGKKGMLLYEQSVEASLF